MNPHSKKLKSFVDRINVPNTSMSLVEEEAIDNVASLSVKYDMSIGESFSMIYTTKHDFIYANSNTQKVSGYATKTWLNNGPAFHISLQRKNEQRIFCEQAIKATTLGNRTNSGSDISAHCEICLKHDDGSFRWYLQKIAYIYKVGERFAASHLLLTDITHLKRDNFVRYYWVQESNNAYIYYACFPTDDLINLGLTKTEIEIINLMASGYSNEDIADKIFVTRNTVKTHRKNIIKKLPVKNALHLIKFAFQHGIIYDDIIKTIRYENMELYNEVFNPKSLRTLNYFKP